MTGVCHGSDGVRSAPIRSIALVAVLLLAAPLVAGAQPAGKVHRIGLLDSGPPSPAAGTASQWEAFREGLRAFGYVEGRSLTIHSRWADEKYERLPSLAAELVRLDVDVIVVRTTPAALAARGVSQAVPIVILVANDPVGAGLVASLARPGGNITGLTTLSPDLSAKRVQLLKEVIPRLSRLAVLWNAANPANAAAWRETQEAARTLGVELQSRPVAGARDFEGVFGMMARERPDALLIVVDALIGGHANQIADFAVHQRLPTMAGARASVEAGCLIGYAPNTREMARRGAYYVNKILKGAKPADLPVEQPTKFELVINMKTAKALGLTVPQSLLLRADHVIE
jgi:putative ABC transport system substrate-binding protein